MSDAESFQDFFLRTEPLLGLATTSELLAEIKARGEQEERYREEGDAMAIGAANLIDMLPGSMLHYRTIDGDTVCEVCEERLGHDIHKGFNGELCHERCCSMCKDFVSHETEDGRLALIKTNLASLLANESNVLNVADYEWLIAEVDRLSR